jgi:glycerol-3-phosphate acyltransferase PlsX
LTHIALDALGGDLGYTTRLKGALDAIRSSNDISITVVGDHDSIENTLQQGDYLPFRDRFSIVHAPDNFPMDESPSKILKSGKTSSLYQSIQLVQNQSCDAIVSAGNTGAQMAASLFILGRIEGISRPGIAIPFPTNKGMSTLIDAGANLDSKPENLLDFALMGTTYHSLMFSCSEPKVAVINNGSEPSKGNILTKAAYSLLKEKIPSSFQGYVEGRDLFSGDIQVMVCDGFVGNIVLKTVEGSMIFIKEFFKKEISSSLKHTFGGLLLKDSFSSLKKMLDYREYGGSPLLGVKGISIICHGSSDHLAIKNAVLQAAKLHKQNFIQKITPEL